MKLPVVILLGFIFTSIITWPFLANINTWYSDSGDYPLVGWILTYNVQSVLSGRILDFQSYFNAPQFYPWPYSLAFSEHMFVSSLIYLPIYLLSSHLIFSVNYFTFLTFVLTFTSCFYVLKYFVRNNWASIFGSLVFTFNPVIFAHFPSHLHLLSRFFLPPLFLFCYKLLTSPSLKNSLFFYAAFTLNSLSSIYFQTFSLILLPVFALPVLILWSSFLKIIKVSAVAAIFVPFLLYFNLPYLQFSQKEGIVREIRELEHYSGRGFDWIIHPLFARQLDFLREPKEPNGKINLSEHTLFVNFIPVALSIVGLIHTLRRPTVAGFCFLTLMVASFLLTFAAIYQPFHKLSPVFQAIRVPTRFQIVFYLPLAYFVAQGTLHLIRSSKKLVNASLIILLVLLILENVRPWDFSSTSQLIKGYDYLRGKNTVHYPILPGAPAMATGYLTWSLQTGENLFNGYSGYFPADWIELVNLFGKLDRPAFRAMRGLGLDYLIIHENQQIRVIDLSKYAVKTCRFQDIKIETETITLPVREPEGINFQTLPKITLKNQKDCYLVNKYQERYKKVSVYFNDQIKSFNVKLPVLIKPFEEVRLGL